MVAKQLEGDVEGPLLVPQHQIIERFLVACPAAVQQLLVAGRVLGIRLYDTLHGEKFPAF
jgi:hypothetical protein